MYEKEILDALRSGTVPKSGLKEIIVGQEKPLREIINELEEIKSYGRTKVRFIQGEYGSGKTIFTTYILQHALSNKFCVSQVVIDPNTQLGNFSQVYNSLCKNLRTPNSAEGSGINNILEEWSLKQLKIFQNVEGINKNNLSTDQINSFIKYIETELLSVRNINPSFSHAIGIFAGSKLHKNDIWKYALNWIRANDSIPAKEYSKHLGLKGKIDSADAYNFLKALLLLIKESGCFGTVIVLDEVETIRRLPNPGQRKKAYEIIRHIIDDTSSGQFRNSLFLITATPEFFSSRKGITEYEALERRIKQLHDDEKRSSHKQPIIPLTPLTKVELFKLACNVRSIHENAESWDIRTYFPDEKLKKITKELTEGFAGSLENNPRNFVRRLVEKFDLRKEEIKFN